MLWNIFTAYCSFCYQKKNYFFIYIYSKDHIQHLGTLVCLKTFETKSKKLIAVCLFVVSHYWSIGTVQFAASTHILHGYRFRHKWIFVYYFLSLRMYLFITLISPVRVSTSDGFTRQIKYIWLKISGKWLIWSEISIIHI